MAIRKNPFAVGEWYHCYSRGVDKRIVFEDKHDYYRFLEQMYLANNNVPFRRDNIRKKKFTEILQTPRKESLVEIYAFCLMPNHFHLVLKEITEGGITKFMQKLGTAYTMYFNTRNSRNGNLFVKPFRSQHVDTDRYFQYLINYVHCNPAELFEPKWKTGVVRNTTALADKLSNYPYSSLRIYENRNSPLRVILNDNIFKAVSMVPTKKLLQEAQQYYTEHPELP